MTRIQNYVADILGQPWPATEGERPEPRTRRTGQAVEMWFGDEPTPRIRPVSLPSSQAANGAGYEVNGARNEVGSLRPVRQD